MVSDIKGDTCLWLLSAAAKVLFIYGCTTPSILLP